VSDLSLDAVVVGAGVVGLAVADRLVRAGLSTVVVERHPGPGRETSSRNSEVVHAGIYYPPGSLRARLCVRGNHLLYRFCQDHDVACRAVGKLVVAHGVADVASLEELKRRGDENGASDLQLVDRDDVRRLEPTIEAQAALVSPSTGVVDSHDLIKVLEARTRAAGGHLLYRCQVTRIDPTPNGFTIGLQNPSGEEQLDTRLVINAAGLESDRVAAMAGCPRYRLHWCKGDYFTVVGSRHRSVSHLVYPVPGQQLVGLGVHVTLDLAGRMRLGPDATYVARDARGILEVDATKASAFFQAARRYLPGLRLEELQPDMAGIRPKLQGPDDPWCDFAIAEDVPGLVNLVGIDSPGLTASLAIAEEVEGVIGKYL